MGEEGLPMGAAISMNAAANYGGLKWKKEFARKITRHNIYYCEANNNIPRADRALAQMLRGHLSYWGTPCSALGAILGSRENLNFEGRKLVLWCSLLCKTCIFFLK